MDPEIEAMGQIATALQPLDTDAVRRVLKWAIERYQPRPTPQQLAAGPAEAATMPGMSVMLISLAMVGIRHFAAI